MGKLLDRFDEAVADYISDLRNTGMSERTIDNYSKRLGYFRTHISKYSNTDSEDVTANDVRGWRDALMNSGVSIKTVRQYLTELKAFFEYATDEAFSYFKINPVSKRVFPKLPQNDSKPYNKVLSNDDMKSLWQNKAVYGAALWPRNYAIITLLLDGKIRNAELLDMKLSDIDWDYSEVVIPKGKGNKYRVVSLSDISLTAVKLYLDSGIRPDDCDDDDYLFGTTAEHKFGGNSTGEEWHRGSSAWLSKLVEKHIYELTGKRGFRSHSLRHNGAMLDLNNGDSLERIQAELGHASVTTTEIYAGRLQSRRHSRDVGEVFAERDRCAEANKRLIYETNNRNRNQKSR